MRGASRLTWILPSAALVVLIAQIMACVLAYRYVAPIDAAWEADPERLRGVLHARPAGVWAARRALALIWMATVPVAMAATMLAVSAIDRFCAQGAVHTFAQTVTVAGVTTSITGVVLAVLAVLEILSSRRTASGCRPDRRAC